MSDIKRKGSVSDVRKGVKDEMQRTDKLAEGLGQSSSNLDHLNRLDRGLTSDLPEEAARDLSKELRYAYQEGLRDVVNRDAELEGQMDREAEQAGDVASAARDADADRRRLEATAREVPGSTMAEGVGREAGRLSKVTADLEKVAQEATTHLRDTNKTQRKLRKSLEPVTEFRKGSRNNYGITDNYYELPADEKQAQDVNEKADRLSEVNDGIEQAVRDDTAHLQDADKKEGELETKLMEDEKEIKKYMPPQHDDATDAERQRRLEVSYMMRRYSEEQRQRQRRLWEALYYGKERPPDEE